MTTVKRIEFEIDKLCWSQPTDVERVEDYSGIAEHAHMWFTRWFAARTLDKKTATARIEYPATLWQHFKAEVFPAWCLKRWPVRNIVLERTATIDATALYPDVEVTREDVRRGHMTLQVFEPGPLVWPEDKLVK